MLGHNASITYYARSPQLVRVAFNIGERLPVYVAVGARAILASSEPDAVDSLLKGKLEQ
ncbi:MAG TPA: hypothetical protein VMW89_06605 [Desulfatiglandales bacterium]|nr:hypothetical protein [Desulfatiglandales bacterium]